ncbi:MAG: hypothetical protein H8E48_05025 [Chloroflexi bacterium]|nr:hypothetical protein [Chloroflexota bacterium]
MESLGKLKKVTEHILEVDEEGEALCNHEVTILLHDVDRVQFLQMVRQMRADKPVGLVLTFIQPEMNMEGLDDQVRDAMAGEPSQELAEAMGFKVGQEVVIKESNTKGEIAAIRSGVTEPMFLVPTDGQENREFRADELAQIVDEDPGAAPAEEPEKTPTTRRSRRSRASSNGEGNDGAGPAGADGSTDGPDE